MLQKRLTKDELKEEDFAAYLASDDEEEEEEGGEGGEGLKEDAEAIRAKYRWVVEMAHWSACDVVLLGEVSGRGGGRGGGRGRAIQLQHLVHAHDVACSSAPCKVLHAEAWMVLELGRGWRVVPSNAGMQ